LVSQASPIEMTNAFLLLGLLIAANAYFFIRSRRKIRSRRDALESNESELPHTLN
jgi:hypothetical protein